MIDQFINFADFVRGDDVIKYADIHPDLYSKTSIEVVNVQKYSIS